MTVTDIPAIAQIIKTSPFLGTIAFIAYVYRKKVSEFIDSISKREKVKPIENLKFHNLFNVAETVKSQVLKIDFTTNDESDEIKSKLVKKLVVLEINFIVEDLKDFLDTKDLSSKDPNMLKYLVSLTISCSSNKYADEAIKVFMSKYSIEKEDSRYMTECYDLFRKEFNDGFLTRIESITTNQDYSTNYEKISTILEVIAISLLYIPKDARQALDKANGRFKKYLETEKTKP